VLDPMRALRDEQVRLPQEYDRPRRQPERNQ
jgi:hypothetical protein